MMWAMQRGNPLVFLPLTSHLSGIIITAQKKNTIYQVTTMLATSKTVPFIGHNHRYWRPDTLTIARAPARVIIKVSGHQYWWLAGGYDLEIGHFLEVANMVVTWWIVAFLVQCITMVWCENSVCWQFLWALHHIGYGNGQSVKDDNQHKAIIYP